MWLSCISGRHELDGRSGEKYSTPCIYMNTHSLHRHFNQLSHPSTETSPSYGHVNHRIVPIPKAMNSSVTTPVRSYQDDKGFKELHFAMHGHQPPTLTTPVTLHLKSRTQLMSHMSRLPCVRYQKPHCISEVSLLDNPAYYFHPADIFAIQ